MLHIHDDSKALLKRVRRIQGQLGSIERAIEGEGECGAVLQQLAAVRGAINGLIYQVMEGHMTAHVSQESANATAELAPVLAVLKTYLK